MYHDIKNDFIETIYLFIWIEVSSVFVHNLIKFEKFTDSPKFWRLL